MSIDLNLVKQLRSQTGVGMMECKEALEESGGDLGLALEALRKRGILKAAKKVDRVANEGLIAVAASEDQSRVALVQVQCETDFVARTEIFINFIQDLAQKALAGLDAKEEFEKQKEALVLKLGENLVFGKFEVLEGSCVASYLHANHKLGSAVVINQVINIEIVHDLAMQVAASAPSYIKPEDVPVEVLEKEKEIYREQLKNEGKPTEMIDKILIGKLNKYFEEVCLLKQPFIKDDKRKVEQLLPAGAEVVKFARYSL